MKVVSFLSDFGLNDNFVGVVKAVILKINPLVQIVDICHQIKSHNILEAGFILKSSFKFFPKSTVHLAVVDPGVGTERKKLIVKTKNFYFVAPDNGLLSLVLEKEPPLKIIEITNRQYFLKPLSCTFHARDIFAPVVAYLTKGEPLENFGREINTYKKIDLPEPTIKGSLLEGEIIYIDHFGNLVTNIEEQILKEFVKHRRFKIRIKNFTIDKISTSYQETEISDKPVALIDSFGYLEIALKEKNAAKVLGLDRKDKIKVLVF